MRSTIWFAFGSTGMLFAGMAGGCGGGSAGNTGGSATTTTTHSTASSSSSSSSSSGPSSSSSSGGPTKFSFTTFDGPAGPPTTINGINNNGEAVGFTTTTGDAGSVNANFIRKVDGTFAAVDVGDPAGSANAINKTDAIAGVANGSAFLLMSGGTPTSLTPFGMSSSVAFGISDVGVIVGQYVVDPTHSPGFVDVNGTFTAVTPTTASVGTFVQGVNNDGLAAGFYTEDGTTQHGFLYETTAQTMTLLTDPSTAKTAGNNLVLTQVLGINDDKQTVGYYQTKDGSQYGFLFDVKTMTYAFLDYPMAAPVNGVQITQITGIDNAGEIAGFFIDASGAQHGFVANPSP